MVEASFPVVNTYAVFRSLRIRRLARRWPKDIRDAVGLVNSTRMRYPPLDPALRASLLESFRQDNRDLAMWLGRDLSVWES